MQRTIQPACALDESSVAAPGTCCARDRIARPLPRKMSARRARDDRPIVTCRSDAPADGASRGATLVGGSNSCVKSPRTRPRSQLTHNEQRSTFPSAFWRFLPTSVSPRVFTMGVKGGAKCAKYFLFVLNTIFFLAGALLLAIGLWLRFDKRIDSYFQHSQSSPFYAVLGVAVALQTAYAIFIAFGAFIFVVGFCGCCGAIKESRCLLGFYVAFIIAVMAGELGGGIYAFIKLREVVDTIETNIVSDLNDNYKKNTSLINDALMSKFECCGWNGYQDFQFMSPTLPRPCCFTVNSTCLASMAPANVYGGCENVISDTFTYAGKIFIGVGIGLVLLEIIVLIAGIALCCSIERY